MVLIKLRYKHTRLWCALCRSDLNKDRRNAAKEQFTTSVAVPLCKSVKCNTWPRQSCLRLCDVLSHHSLLSSFQKCDYVTGPTVTTNKADGTSNHETLQLVKVITQLMTTICHLSWHVKLGSSLSSNKQMKVPPGSSALLFDFSLWLSCTNVRAAKNPKLHRQCFLKENLSNLHHSYATSHFLCCQSPARGSWLHSGASAWHNST